VGKVFDFPWSLYIFSCSSALQTRSAAKRTRKDPRLSLEFLHFEATARRLSPRSGRLGFGHFGETAGGPSPAQSFIVQETPHGASLQWRRFAAPERASGAPKPLDAALAPRGVAASGQTSPLASATFTEGSTQSRREAMCIGFTMQRDREGLGSKHDEISLLTGLLGFPRRSCIL